LYSGPRDNNPAYKANWVRRKHGDLYQPSTDWAQGGPIIERENISTVREGDAGNWIASVYDYAESDWHLHTGGTTPLEAAMRCYVASKLGDEVEIPKELTQGEIK
jgi:hypothetical protein